MDITKLRPDTRALWQRLENHPLLKGFVLIGGTALTLRIGHRISEDLDFAYPDKRLPLVQLELLRRNLAAAEVPFDVADSPTDVESFLNDGMDLRDYQQDYMANSVKVTFVALEREMCTALRPFAPQAPLRVATLDEIFATKCLACGDRNKSRDWFDLFILMTRHGYAGRDLHSAFLAAGAPAKYDIAASRLRRCVVTGGPNDDPGYEHLLDEAPTLEQMRQFFCAALDDLEVGLAAQAFAEKRIGGPGAPSV